MGWYLVTSRSWGIRVLEDSFAEGTCDEFGCEFRGFISVVEDWVDFDEVE